jgi:hypothetical protein
LIDCFSQFLMFFSSLRLPLDALKSMTDINASKKPLILSFQVFQKLVITSYLFLITS